MTLIQELFARPTGCPIRSGSQRAKRSVQAGQGMVEYAFILVLIALVVLVMLITTGGQVHNLYSDITTGLKNPAGL